MKYLLDGKHILAFKNRAPVEKSSVTLAGTGPNAAIQIPVLHLLSSDYIRQLESLDIISGSTLAFFTHIANEERGVNLKRFELCEYYIRRIHTLPINKRVYRWRTNQHLFDNELISKSVHFSFGWNFCQRKLSDIALPVNFHTYCITDQELVELNATTYPNMKLRDVAQACMSVPSFHGAFSYQGKQYIDPIFCPKYSILRKRLFEKTGNTLFVNHKKSLESGNVYFLTPQRTSFPELQLQLDFFKFYFGITNGKILRTHAKILREKILKNSF